MQRKKKRLSKKPDASLQLRRCHIEGGFGCTAGGAGRAQGATRSQGCRGHCGAAQGGASHRAAAGHPEPGKQQATKLLEFSGRHFVGTQSMDDDHGM